MCHSLHLLYNPLRASCPPWSDMQCSTACRLHSSMLTMLGEGGALLLPTANTDLCTGSPFTSHWPTYPHACGTPPHHTGAQEYGPALHLLLALTAVCAGRGALCGAQKHTLTTTHSSSSERSDVRCLLGSTGRQANMYACARALAPTHTPSPCG